MGSLKWARNIFTRKVKGFQENGICCFEEWGLLGHLLSSLVAQLVKNLPAMQETQVRFRGPEDPLEKQPAPVLLADFMDRGAGKAAAHRIAKSWT